MISPVGIILSTFIIKMLHHIISLAIHFIMIHHCTELKSLLISDRKNVYPKKNKDSLFFLYVCTSLNWLTFCFDFPHY